MSFLLEMFTPLVERAASPPPSSSGHVPDRGRELVTLLWILTSIAFMTALARLLFRAQKKTFGWDDIFMALSMFCFFGWSIVLTLYSQKGGERHIYDLAQTGPDNIATVLFLNWLAQVFGIMGVGFGKVSVSALLLGVLRMTEMKWHRIYLWSITITLAMLVAVSCSTLTFAQCSPAKALWDTRVHGKCINPTIMGDYGTFTGAFNTFADASLAIIPATIFWSLNTSTTEKIQLTIVFGLNIFTAICSGIKTQYLAQLGKRTDSTWATLDIFIWVTVELFLMIVCGTIPTLHPLLKLVKKFIADATDRISSRSHRVGGSSKLTDEESTKQDSVSRKNNISVVKKRNTLNQVYDTELRRLSGRTAGLAKTTVERGDTLLDSESVDELVPPDKRQLGVRVEVAYDVTNSSRPQSWNT